MSSIDISPVSSDFLQSKYKMLSTVMLTSTSWQIKTDTKGIFVQISNQLVTLCFPIRIFNQNHLRHEYEWELLTCMLLSDHLEQFLLLQTRVKQNNNTRKLKQKSKKTWKVKIVHCSVDFPLTITFRSSLISFLPNTSCSVYWFLDRKDSIDFSWRKWRQALNNSILEVKLKRLGFSNFKIMLHISNLILIATSYKSTLSFIRFWMKLNYVWKIVNSIDLMKRNIL